MNQPKVATRSPEVSARMSSDADAAWRGLGWFGLLLAMLGAGDILLAWYPPGFGLIEWEFGTISSSIAGLPLVTVGLAALFGTSLARGRRWLVRTVGLLLLLAAVVVLAALALFLTDIPIALQTVTNPALIGIKKAIVKTLFLGAGFAFSYLIAGIITLRRLR